MSVFKEFAAIMTGSDNGIAIHTIVWFVVRNIRRKNTISADREKK